MSQSEIARLLKQIDLEYEAAERGLSGIAQMARHDFITARTENIANYQKQLVQLVGKEEAFTLLTTASTDTTGGE